MKRNCNVDDSVKEVEIVKKATLGRPRKPLSERDPPAKAKLDSLGTKVETWYEDIQLENQAIPVDKEALKERILVKLRPFLKKNVSSSIAPVIYEEIKSRTDARETEAELQHRHMSDKWSRFPINEKEKDFKNSFVLQDNEGLTRTLQFIDMMKKDVEFLLLTSERANPSIFFDDILITALEEIEAFRTKAFMKPATGDSQEVNVRID